MRGSALEDLFEQVYASNSAIYLFSIKTISRAICRAHILAHSALVALLSEIINVTDISNLQSIKDPYKKVVANQSDIGFMEEVTSSSVISSIYSRFEGLKERLKTQSRTSKLWLHYMNYVETIKLLIFAELTGN